MSPPFVSWPSVFLMMAVTLGITSAYGGGSIAGANGIVARVDDSGRYEIQGGSQGWIFGGQLPLHVDVATSSGQDAIGTYREIRVGLRTPERCTASIRAYRDRPVVMFLNRLEVASTAAPAWVFPEFTRLPRGLHCFSYGESEFSPPKFSAEQNGSPWLLFDDAAHAAIISPAANFMIARLSGDGVTRIASGLNPGVTQRPAGFTQATLLTFGDGINGTWEEWGVALTRLVGRQRPPNDADIGLRYLGYWTDNGADYYYNYDAALGYTGTLLALAARYRQEKIPIRYLQLDSWWYYKSLTNPDGTTGHPKNPHLPEGEWNRYGGLLKYEAHPALFSQGLGSFQRQIRLPLITHNRWIDPASPYHAQYRISGFAAVDPGWWQDIMGYLAGSGVVGYEQDWLNVIYEHSPELGASIFAGDAFTGGMARAAAARGLTLQYCMALPRYFLQGARYSNLTTIRTSGDRFNRDRWDWFLYTSRLASAVGIWPWTDVFMSGEKDNLLIATLSAGMVGTGDRIGAENRDNILRAVRADGVIVKPDRPLVPIDSIYYSDAAGHQNPMIAATYTQHAVQRTVYVVAYARNRDLTKASFAPAEVGMNRDCYVYDVGRRTAQRVSPNGPIRLSVSVDRATYLTLAPVSTSGIAFFGDEEKFVSNGRKRIAEIHQEGGAVIVKAVFARGEPGGRFFGYATAKPVIRASGGSIEDETFDGSTGRFEVTVRPGSELGEESPGNDPVAFATIAISSGH